MRTSRLLEILQTDALAEIYGLGILRAPAEACGLLLDTAWMRADGSHSYVLEMPNRTLLTQGQYVMHAEDIRLALAGHEEVEEVAVWHTHPSGFEGPSAGDLANRPHSDINMFVVALTDDGPVATWF